MNADDQLIYFYDRINIMMNLSFKKVSYLFTKAIHFNNKIKLEKNMNDQNQKIIILSKSSYVNNKREEKR